MLRNQHFNDYKEWHKITHSGVFCEKSVQQYFRSVTRKPFLSKITGWAFLGECFSL